MDGFSCSVPYLKGNYHHCNKMNQVEMIHLVAENLVKSYIKC